MRTQHAPEGPRVGDEHVDAGLGDVSGPHCAAAGARRLRERAARGANCRTPDAWRGDALGVGRR